MHRAAVVLKMNKSFIILFFVFLCSELSESRPRYGYSSWSKFLRSSFESSEENSFESNTNIGNGYKNHNNIYKNSYPNYRENQGQTEIYQGIQQENEGQLVTENGYRTTSKSYNSFEGNESQRGDGSNNNQRPFRPNANQIHANRRPYNDYKTNYNRERTSEIGDFGNGHHNTNTFNIHKKNIYIS